MVAIGDRAVGARKSYGEMVFARPCRSFFFSRNRSDNKAGALSNEDIKRRVSLEIAITNV